MKKLPIGIKKDFTVDDIGSLDEPNKVKGIYNKDITITIYNHFGGYNFLFENEKNGKTLSAIYHKGSYGCESGLFEIMPPKAPKSWGDSVKGHLTFAEVINWVNKSLK